MSTTAVQNGGYELPKYAFVPPRELSGERHRHPVVIVGAGVAGLALACDLAARGIAAVVLDDDNTVGVRGASSRGICYARKNLEMFDRLGVWPRIRDKAVTWSVGKTLVDDEVVFQFNLAQGNASRQPPFVNLQQFYLEAFLVDRVQELGTVELRWLSTVVSARQQADHVVLGVDTPAGSYEIEADYVVDASGVAGAVRRHFDLHVEAEQGEDLWCISDVRFTKPLPVERWTWVAASFNEGRAVWQHLMADGVWRIDYQMPPGADRDTVTDPVRVKERLRAHLGEDTEFELVWVGPYGYRTQLLERFSEGRVFFIGDAAHVKSPFGARGGNSGMQDAENLGWKLAMVLGGHAAPRLLDSYHLERRPAAEDNIHVTRRSARFLAPASEAERRLRRAVLGLAREYEFARPIVNTGRMAVPYVYADSPLVSNGGDALPNLAVTLPDGEAAGLVDVLRLAGNRLVALWITPDAEALSRHGATFARLVAEGMPVAVYVCGASVDDLPSLSRLDLAGIGAEPGMLVLIRPDQHVAARIADASPSALRQAVDQALGS